MNLKTIKHVFHILNYLQYPLYLVAFYFSIKPYFNGIDHAIENLDMLISNMNYFFIFLGLGISFSSLQDASRINLKIEKKVLQDSGTAKIFILITSIATALMMIFGVVGYFIMDNIYLNEISVGVLVLGISFVGVVKFQLEQVELHSKHAIQKAEVDEP